MSIVTETTPLSVSGAMIVGAVIGFLSGSFFQSTTDWGGCPVSIGDQVRRGSVAGEVRAIAHNGAATQNCQAGVVWDDGSSEYTHGWKLAKTEG